MRRRRLLSLSLAWALLRAAARVAAADELPEPIVTNEPRFEIPLQIEADDPSVAEVRLYHSADAGKTWTASLKAKPPLNNLEFKAPHDGEYWFLVRTADLAGREEPSGDMTPELRVIVDATPPQVELKTERAANGDVILQWNCRDRKWNSDSLKVTYRVDGDPTWRSVDSLRTKRHGDPTTGGGEIEWTPPADAPEATLRVEIRDEAGNVTVQETTAGGNRLTRPSPASPGSAAASPRDPSRPMWVNSLSFELDYDIGRVAPSRVENVAIWGTRDDGRSWVQLGVDDDRRTPCAVNVDREGMYGFAIVVTAVGAESISPPQAGDSPEIRVGVDLRKPEVRLTTAEPDPEGKACFMKINWQANDQHLGPQAVSLAYSARANGPWLPLALGVANDGGRLCEFDPHGPDAVYLRIEVRDEAGNLGAFSTTAPVPVEKRDLGVHLVGKTEGAKAPSTPKWFHVLR